MPAIVKSHLSSSKTDPLKNFRFVVSVNHVTAEGNHLNARLGFTSVSGLSSETDVVAYREGNMNTTTQKSPGQTNFPPLTLARGMMVGTPDQYQWFKEIFAVNVGTGNGPNPNAGGEFRSDIDIYLLAHPYTRAASVPVKAKWHVYNAWPQSLAFSDLDAGGNAVVMEQMVLQHEGYGIAYAADTGASDVSNVTKF